MQESESNPKAQKKADSTITKSFQNAQEHGQKSTINRKRQTETYGYAQKSRNTGNWKRGDKGKAPKEQKKKYYVAAPEYEEINRESGLAHCIKELKKLFLESKSGWGEIISQTYLADKNKPMIALKIFYKQGYYSKESTSEKTLNLSQLISIVPKLKDKYENIKKIFDQLYQSVDESYTLLARFAVERCKEKQKFDKESFTSNIEKGEFSFYFKENSKRLYFTVLDKKMNFVQFDSTFIKDSKEKLKDQYKMYEYFNKVSLKAQAKKQTTNSIFNKEEAQSDEQTHNYGKNRNTLRDLREMLEDALQQVDIDKESETETEKEGNCLGGKLKEVKKLKKTIAQSLGEARKKRLDTFQFYQKSLIRILIAQRQATSELPILKNKHLILDKIKSEKLIIIEGETGSGKSTQLPQLLLQHFNLLESQGKPILITQPRRLSTRSLAERVASQIGEQVGNFVDYAASAGTTLNPKAKIVFMLDRIVVDELKKDPKLSQYSCLVIDEAHQRTMSIDIILGLVKPILQERQDFKVIVSSASMDLPLFENYFSSTAIKVTGRQHDIKIYYKDYKQYSSGDRNETIRKIQKVIREEILVDNAKMRIKGNVLCFCSGIQQISKLVKIYEEFLSPRQFEVYPLHQRIDPQEQKRMMRASAKKKFIFASRIAETAITIKGVNIVIDPGEDIEVVYRKDCKIFTTKLTEITQSSAKQRAGRAGRTSSGFCFRLYSEENYSKRQICKVPQIENCSLETVILRLKYLGVSDAANFAFITPPRQQDINRSLQHLIVLGAISKEDRELSTIGQLISMIPVDPTISRAIVQAMVFQRVFKKETQINQLNKQKPALLFQIYRNHITQSVIVVMLMMLHCSNLFESNSKKQGETQEKQSQQIEPQRDVNRLLAIWEEYTHLQRTNYTNKSKILKYVSGQIKKWTTQNNLNLKVLIEIQAMAEQIKLIVSQLSLDQSLFHSQIQTAEQRLRLSNSYEELVLSCLMSSLSFNLCKYSGHQQISYILVAQNRSISYASGTEKGLREWIIAYDFIEDQNERICCRFSLEVSYEFIERHLSEDVFELLRISEVNKGLHLYIKCEKQLPTQIVSDIKHSVDALLSDSKILKIIDEENNKVTFIKESKTSKVLSQNKQAALESQQQALQGSVAAYLKQFEEAKKVELVHKYEEKIKVVVGGGFKILDFQFGEIQRMYCFQVTSTLQIIDCLVENFKNQAKIEFDLTSKNNKQAEKLNLKVFQMRTKIKLIFLQPNAKTRLYSLVQLLKQSTGAQIVVKQSMLQHQNNQYDKVRAKLLFFAGERQQSETYLYSPLYSTGLFNSVETILKKKKRFETIYKIIQVPIPAYSFRSYFYGIPQKKTTTTRTVSQLIEIQQPYTPQQVKVSKLFHNRTQIHIYSKINPDIEQQRAKAKQKKQTYRNGVSITNDLDEVEMMKELKKLSKNLTFGKSINSMSVFKNRRPKLPQAKYSDQQWINKVYQILNDCQLGKQHVSIRKVSGKTNKISLILHRQNHKPALSNYYSSFQVLTYGLKSIYCLHQIQGQRVQLTIQLQFNSLADYDRLVKQIDGKTNIIGTQKVHLVRCYSQLFTSFPAAAYQLYQQDIKQIQSQFNTKQPTFKLNISCVSVKNQQFTQISGQSDDNQVLQLAFQKVISLTRPQTLPLTATNYRILKQTELGKQIINKMQQKFQYKIMFNFQQNEKKLVVHRKYLNRYDYNYQHRLGIEQIYSAVIKEIQSCSIIQTKLPYSGRSVNKVRNILEDSENNRGNNFLIFDIIFDKAELQLIGKQQTIDRVTEIIESLPSKKQFQCIICAGLISSPYKLIDCHCSFCRECIIEYTKSFKGSSETILRCPNYECKYERPAINIHDIKALLSEEQMKKITDLRVKKHTQLNYQKYLSCKRCPYFFEKKLHLRQMQVVCPFCGYSECLQCGHSHPKISCRQWRLQISEREDILKSGAKQCPRCKMGIFKDGGCNHMTCTRCKSHICWKCLQLFETAKQCTDHLFKMHGGIYDAGT